MELHAIFTDLDGTLVNSHFEVSPRTKEAIRKAREEGYYFGLATGRDLDSLPELLEKWGITSLVDGIVASQGAEIQDFRLNQRIQFGQPVQPAALQAITKTFQDLKVNVVIPEQGSFVALKDDDLIRKMAELNAVPYRVENFDTYCNQPKIKIMILCDPADMDQVVERATCLDASGLKVAGRKTSPYLYEYMDVNVDKSTAIEALLQLHGWNSSMVVCFGDEDNDETMIWHAGRGVCMDNGSAKAKRHADYITNDHDHDGVALFIETHLLGEEDPS